MISCKIMYVKLNHKSIVSSQLKVRYRMIYLAIIVN